MNQIHTIPLSKIVEDFRLEVVVKPDNFEEIQISSPEVNRPGLALAPSRKTPDGEFKDIVHPLNTETREMIKEIVLKAFDEAKNSADAE